MTMTNQTHRQTPDQARLEARIAKLERKSSITTGACAVMALGLAGAVLGGAGEDEKAPWLTASGLTIVDAAGNERIHMAARLPDLADACGLQILNAEGAEVSSLTSRTSGQTMLTVSDGTTDRVAAGVWGSGEGGLYVLGPQSQPGYRAQLAVDQDGRTYYILRGSDEEYITRIGEPGGGGAAQAQSSAIQPPAGNPWQQQMGGAGAGGVGAGGWPGGAGAGMPGAGGAGAGGWPGGAGAGMPGAGGAGAGAWRGGPGAGAGGWPGGAGAGMPGAGAGAPGAGESPGLENLPEDVRQRIEEMRERARKMREESMREAERMRREAESGEGGAESDQTAAQGEEQAPADDAGESGDGGEEQEQDEDPKR